MLSFVVGSHVEIGPHVDASLPPPPPPGRQQTKEKRDDNNKSKISFQASTGTQIARNQGGVFSPLGNSATWVPNVEGQSKVGLRHVQSRPAGLSSRKTTCVTPEREASHQEKPNLISSQAKATGNVWCNSAEGPLLGV